MNTHENENTNSEINAKDMYEIDKLGLDEKYKEL